VPGIVVSSVSHLLEAVLSAGLPEKEELRPGRISGQGRCNQDSAQSEAALLEARGPAAIAGAVSLEADMELLVAGLDTVHGVDGFAGGGILHIVDKADPFAGA